MNQEKQEKINKSYYAIIPANVRYDNDLTPNAKLLYGEITALCNEKGYCWASNGYFAELYDVSKKSVSTWINKLVEKKHIISKIIYKKNSKEVLERRLYIYLNPIEKDVIDPMEEKVNTYGKEVRDPVEDNFHTPMEEKVKDNNTVINNTSNNTIDNLSIYLEGKKSKLPSTRKQDTEKQDIKIQDIRKQDTEEQDTYNTNSINTNSTKYKQSINHQKEKKEMDRIDENKELVKFENYKKLIKENISYELLLEEQGEIVNDLYKIIVDILITKKGIVKIGGEEKPISIVKSVFEELDQHHLEYVINKFKNTDKKINNIKAYLITMLYNAPKTINTYYDNKYYSR